MRFISATGLVGTELLQLPYVAVLAVDDPGNVLLVRHADTGVWGVAGGAIEMDETPHEAAVRERRRGRSAPHHHVHPLSAPSAVLSTGSSTRTRTRRPMWSLRTKLTSKQAARSPLARKSPRRGCSRATWGEMGIARNASNATAVASSRSFRSP